MNRQTIVAAVLAFVAGGLIVFAVMRFAPEEGAGGEAASPPASDKVAARIDGRPLYFSDVEAMKQMLPSQYRALPTSTIYTQLLEVAVQSELVARAGREAGLGRDPQVLRRLAFAKDRLIESAYRDRLREEGRKQATDAALQARYKTFLDGYQPEEEVRARHILVKTEAEAKTIIEQLDHGADFATLAKEKSTGPSASKGGDLGYFTHDQMIKEFADAAFSMAPGTYSKTPVETQFGWHVIYVEDKRKQPPPKLSEIREQLTEQIASAYMSEAVQKLEKSARIERFNMDGTPMQSQDAGQAPAGEGGKESSGQGKTTAPDKK